MSPAAFQNTSWSRLTIVQKLLVVNVAVFALINIVNAVFGLFLSSLDQHVNVTSWLAVPASLGQLATRPWTLFTYMFLHEGFMHILFNMLWLYWMGIIFLEYLGPQKLFSTYVLGGIAGALLYILSFNVFPLFRPVLNESFALGASAAVLAITVGIATLLPNYSIRLLLIGNVPLKYIAGFTLLLDLIQISGTNAGGHIAHLGGAMFGFVYIRQLQKGKDLAEGFNKIIDKLKSWFGGNNTSFRRTSRKARAVSDEDYIQDKKSRQEQIDRILDKISKSGYGSLTQKEKDILFRSSKEE